MLEAEMAKQRDGVTFTSEVKQTILKNFQFAFPRLEEIAAHMHITPRTLQRKLQEEHTSFRLLSDLIKQELRHCLKQLQ
jgi:AraC-like DNA-binding protein